MTHAAPAVVHSARLLAGLRQLGLPADAESASALDAYLDLLIRWNGVYNLTSIRDRDKMRSVHLFDSLSIMRPLQQATADVAEPLLVDVGTGAGLPGLPLALLWPGLRVVLVEPIGKKVAFLRQAVGTLGLHKRVAVIGARIEGLRATDQGPLTGNPAHTIPLPDLIVSRAFASLHDFTRAVTHLVGPATRIFAMKGQLPSSEIAKLSPGWHALSHEQLEVPELDARRHLIELGRHPPEGA